MRDVCAADARGMSEKVSGFFANCFCRLAGSHSHSTKSRSQPLQMQAWQIVRDVFAPQ
jgi:hypothetical protein